MITKRNQSCLSLVVAITLLLALLAPATAWGASSAAFTDIEHSYAKSEIQALVNIGVLSGYKDGSFKPQSKMTRAELAKVICLVMGFKEEPGKAAQLADVPTGAWYAGYVGALLSHGVTEGTSPATFSPAAYVTREQLVVLFMRAMGLSDEAEIVPADVKLTDAGAISPWAKALVSLGYKIGFVQGIDNGDGTTRFEPKSLSERQALARLAYEFLQNKGTYQTAAEKLAADAKNTTGTPSASASPAGSSTPGGNGSTPTATPKAGGTGGGGSTPTATPKAGGTGGGGSTPTATPTPGSTDGGGSTPTATPTPGGTDGGGSTPTPTPTPTATSTPEPTPDHGAVTGIQASVDSLSFTGQYSRVVKLTASFADGYTGDVTAYADWSSSDAAIAEAAAGVVSAKSNGSATITATHGGKSVTIGVTVQIVPYDQGVSFLQLSATSLKFLDYSSAKQLDIRAYMFDGSWASVTADTKTQWTSSDSSVVTVDKGQVIPVGAGTAYVSASYMEKTAVAKVMVTNESGSISAPMLVELTALPGQLSFTDPNPQAVKVIARYSDNTVTDVTYQAQWTSDDTNVVYYSSAEGAAVPADNSAGTVLKAVYNGLAAYVPVTVNLSQTPDTLDHLEVAYTSKLDVNADGSITVISSGGSAREHEVMLYAIYANGTRRNITQDAVWNTGNNAVVQLTDHAQRNTKGLYMKDDGDTDVNASYGGQQLVITVHSRFVTELSIQEAVSKKLYLDTPGAHPIHLVATFKNGATVDATTYAQYTAPLSSNIISIDGTGTIYAHSPGRAYFGATYAGFNASAEVFVRAPGLWLEGKGIYVRADQTVSQIELFNSQQAFTLYLNDWSDPQNPDVKKIDAAQATITWASAGDAVALIDKSNGKLNLLPQNITGKGTLIVEYQGYRLEIPVVSHVVDDLNILDAVKDQGVAVSRYHDLGDHYFTVLATMSDGSVKDVTGLSIYYDDNDIAYVSSEYDLNFFSFGEATIKVEFGGRELEWKVIATDGSQGNGNYPVELYASSTGDINAAVSKQDYSQHGLEKPMMVADHLIVKFSENLATSQGYSVYLDGQVSNNWTDGASFNGNIMDLKLKAGAIPQGLHTLVIDGLEDANGNKMDPVVIYLYKQ